jgi:hypothetical protein
MFCLKKNLTNECNIGALTMEEDLGCSFVEVATRSKFGGIHYIVSTSHTLPIVMLGIDPISSWTNRSSRNLTVSLVTETQGSRSTHKLLN